MFMLKSISNNIALQRNHYRFGIFKDLGSTFSCFQVQCSLGQALDAIKVSFTLSLK